MSQTNLQNYITELEAKLAELSTSIADIEKSITAEIESFVEQKPEIDLAAKEAASKIEVGSLNLNLESRDIEQVSDADLEACINQMYKL
ncbi:MAG: hypothetical protein AAGF07_03470 [Patescibacteria group bacterium]